MIEHSHEKGNSMTDDTDLHRCCDRDILRLGRENEALTAAVRELTAEAPRADGKPRMTLAQRNALWALCGGYNVEFNEGDYAPDSSLPDGWVSGWIGGRRHGPGGDKKPTVYVGCSPSGEISS